MEPQPQQLKIRATSVTYTTATETTQGPSRVFNLHHSSRQRQILNPLNKARERTYNFMVPRGIRQPLRHDRNTSVSIF